jgi:C4-dicarboxylate transporter, DctQ subunit
VKHPEQPDQPGFLDLVHRALDRVETGLLCTLLLGLIGLGLTQIILRNFAAISLPWADGAMRAMVLWLAMIAGAIAAGHMKHIRIDVAERWMPPRLRNVVQRLLMLSTAAVCLAMTWFSLRMVGLEYEFRTMAFLNVPTWLVVLIVPIGFGLMAARFTVQAFYPTAPSTAAFDEADPGSRGRPQ